MYKLSGCVIHVGYSADSGHFYSLVRERHPISGVDDKWIRFDDEIVLDFDIKELELEAFGVEEESDDEEEDGDDVDECFQEEVSACIEKVAPNIVPASVESEERSSEGIIDWDDMVIDCEEEEDSEENSSEDSDNETFDEYYRSAVILIYDRL